MTRIKLGPDYRRLWWAAAIDNIGDGVWAAALPLLAVSITRDPRLVSLVAAATYLPWLLLSLPVGALVDRADRVTLMWRSQCCQCLVVVAVTVLTVLKAVDTPLLVIAGFLLGCAETVFSNAAQAVLPDLVEPDQLVTANARQYVAQTVSQLFVGPPLGGLLFAAAVGLPFGVDAGTFAVSAFLLATLPRVGRPAPRHKAAVLDGLRWLGRHRLLRTLALLLGVNNFCNQFAQSTLVLLATSRFGLGNRGYGVLLAGMAVGGVIGGAVNARLATRLGPLRAMIAALTLSAAAFLAVGLAPGAVVLGVILAVSGFAATLWNVVTVSLRQRIVPRDLLGRVNSVYRMLAWGLLPLGAACGGLVAHTLGLRAPYPLAGGIRLLALLAALPLLVSASRSGADRQ